MITVEDLRPGDIMFGPIGGIMPGVLPVGLGQLLLAPRRDRLTWRRWWRVRHVGMVVSAGNGQDPTWESGAHPRLVQAMPSGAEEIDMRADKHWTPRHIYVRPRYRLDESHIWESELAAHAARGYVGTPYGFLTYAALAAAWLIPDGPAGLRLEGRIARRISDRREMICSQLVDQALTDAGFHVFDDGRLPQDVVPAELFRQLIAMPGTQYVVPGMPAWAEAPSYWR